MVDQRAHSRASSKNGKVGLKKNLITQGTNGPNNSQKIPDAALRKSHPTTMPLIESSGRSGLSNLSRSKVNITGQGTKN